MDFSTFTLSLRYQSTKVKEKVSLGKRAKGGVDERSVEGERCTNVRVDKIQMSTRMVTCIDVECSVVVGKTNQ